MDRCASPITGCTFSDNVDSAIHTLQGSTITISKISFQEIVAVAPVEEEKSEEEPLPSHAVRDAFSTRKYQRHGVNILRHSVTGSLGDGGAIEVTGK